MEKKPLTKGKFGLMINYASVAVTVKTEVFCNNFNMNDNQTQHCQVISYGIVSLVSDFGGTLGLFVGFSFFSLWDIFRDLSIVLSHAFMKKFDGK